jgi:nitrogen regulatory protein PII 2
MFMGVGKIQGEFSELDSLGANEEIRGILADGLSQGSRLIPKRLLTILVQDNEVEKVVSALIQVNRAGNKGDGKIFIVPVVDTVRVRTGERGEAAI